MSRTIEIPYQPLGEEKNAPYETVQIDFWDSEAFSPAFIAARGAGKTLCGAAKTLKNVLKYGSNALVVGPRYESQVRAVLVPKYLEIIPKELIWMPQGAGAFHETHKWIVLRDLKTLSDDAGPTIWFRSGDEPETIEGFTVGTVHLDEVGRMDKMVYGLALGCLRDPRGPGQIIATCTPPSGVLHWVNEKWANGVWSDVQGRKGRKITNPSANCPAWNMIWTDNYKLPEAWRQHFEEELDLSTPFGRQQAFGEVVDMGGVIYADFNPKYHCIQRPDDFVRVCGGLDRALSGTTAVALAGTDAGNRVHWFHEWGHKNATLEDVTLQCLGLQQKYPGLWFEADPRPGGEMELETLRRQGVRVERADKRDMLDVGIKLIWDRLKVRADGLPGLFVRPWLAMTIAQMQSWSFTEQAARGGGVISYTEVDHHNRDFIDAARYATVGLCRSDRESGRREIVWTSGGRVVAGVR